MPIYRLGTQRGLRFHWLEVSSSVWRGSIAFTVLENENIFPTELSNSVYFRFLRRYKLIKFCLITRKENSYMCQNDQHKKILERFFKFEFQMITFTKLVVGVMTRFLCDLQSYQNCFMLSWWYYQLSLFSNDFRFLRTWMCHLSIWMYHFKVKMSIIWNHM
jgi:hypothetical protein